MISIGLAWHIAQHNQPPPSSAILCLPSCPSALSGVIQVGTALAQHWCGGWCGERCGLDTNRTKMVSTNIDFHRFGLVSLADHLEGVRRLPNNSQKTERF